MGNQNIIFRTILDSGDVLGNALTAVLVEELVASETINTDECRKLSAKLGAVVKRQHDALIDQVELHFNNK